MYSIYKRDNFCLCTYDECIFDFYAPTYLSIYLSIYEGSPNGVVVKVLDCDIVISEFET